MSMMRKVKGVGWGPAALGTGTSQLDNCLYWIEHTVEYVRSYTDHVCTQIALMPVFLLA